MGKTDDGSFGGYRGKVGGLVTYTLKGQKIVRSVGYSSKPPTPAKLAQYQKMAVVNGFLKPNLKFINSGFAFAVEGTVKNPYNEALSYNKTNALQGEYPDISMDYSKAMVSMGNLPAAIAPAVNLMDDGIEFTWQVDEDMKWDIKNDRAMLLIYFPQKKSNICILSGARRTEGRDFIKLSPAHLDQQMVIYISFMADDRRSVSDSVRINNF